jgi:hypothetical protein
MPKVFEVRANKDYPDEGIKKGERYFKWSIKLQRGGITMKSKTRPRPSQLTRSAFRQPLLQAQEAFEDALNAAETCSDLESARDDFKSELENLRDEQQEKFDNMPEGLQQGDTGQLIEGRVSSLEDMISELEGVDIPDDIEEEEKEEEEKEDCETCGVEFGTGSCDACKARGEEDAKEMKEEQNEQQENFDNAKSELEAVDYQGE